MKSSQTKSPSESALTIPPVAAVEAVDPFAEEKAQAASEGKQWAVIQPSAPGASPFLQIFN